LYRSTRMAGPRSQWLPLAALAAAVVLILLASRGGVSSERPVCNCPAVPAAVGQPDASKLSAELDSLQKLAQLRAELTEARATIDRLKSAAASAPAGASATSAAPAASADCVKLGPVTGRLVEHFDIIDPKQLWKPGNRAWSMSQTVRNHPADAERCTSLASDPQFGQPKPLPAAKNATLRTLPLAKLFNPIANLAAFDEMENLKCDTATPKAPLPPFTLQHKHTHHLSRYTMYFNIMCWLAMEPRYGHVLDVSGSEPWLERFDKARTKVSFVNYPKTDVHDLAEFANETFDWVMGDQVMEHLRFPQQAMDEIHRVLKPGGRAIMTSCAANPVHMFHDYWRFTMDAFKSLSMRFDAMDMCGSWGNGHVNAARALGGQFSGEPGSMMTKAPNGSQIVDPLSLKLAGLNEKDHAMTVWMIVRKT